MSYYDNSKSKKYIKDYLIKERIGVGSYGLVFKVTKKNEKHILVLKQIPYVSKDNKKQIEEIQNEAKLLSLLNSKFIVKYYDSFEENNNIDIIMEYCEGGDLSSYLSNRQKLSKSLPEDRIWKFFIQMSLGLEYLHSKKILHRDLKSMNIFLSKTLDVKIGDLGVAKLLQNTSHAYTFIGTPFYLSPEVCEEKPYNDKSDVWALGCITYEMLTFKHPYEATNHAALFLKIINGKYEPVSNKYSEDIRRLVDLLLEKNYLKRPSMSQIIKMPIFIEKAKQLGLLEYVVDSLENHSNKKGIKGNSNMDLKRPLIRGVNKIGSCKPNLNSNNNNHSSSNIYVSSNANCNNNSNNVINKGKSTTDVVANKKKQNLSQQKVKTNMIDYNYLKYKEQAQLKKGVVNSNVNANQKKTQLSQDMNKNINIHNNHNNKKPSANQINVIPQSQQQSNKKHMQLIQIDNNNNGNSNCNCKILNDEEDSSYKNKYMISKRSNVSETKHSSINTSVNSSRKGSYHGIFISSDCNKNPNINSNDSNAKHEFNSKKKNYSNDYNNIQCNKRYINKNGNNIKFNPGNELNEFIRELNMKSSFLINNDPNSNVNLSKVHYTECNDNNNNNAKYGKCNNNLNNKQPNQEVNKNSPLWNENDQLEANCEFEVIEAANQKTPHAVNNCGNDNSFDDGEYNYHHNPAISDDDKDNEYDNDNEKETVSMLKSTTNFDDNKPDNVIEKENNEMLNRRNKFQSLKEQNFNEITKHSAQIDIGKLFELYKLIERDPDQIDAVTLQIDQYIKSTFPSEDKVNEFSKYFNDYIYYDYNLNQIEKLLNERKNMMI